MVRGFVLSSIAKVGGMGERVIIGDEFSWVQDIRFHCWCCWGWVRTAGVKGIRSLGRNEWEYGVGVQN